MIGRSRGQDRFLATILFTDIVGSTDLAAKIGDTMWRHLVASHNAQVRAQLKRFGGREVDTAGDGFLCRFEQPAQAVRAADAILTEVARLGIQLRAGIHTGECEVIGRKIGGIAVHIAARVMAAASAGQVLVSSTVRDLVSGSQLVFQDAGIHELKGVPGEWHLYALDREVAVAEQEPAFRGPGESQRAAGMSRETKAFAVFGITFGIAVLVAAIVFVLALAGTPAAVVGEPRPDTVVTIDTASGKVIDVHAVQAGPAALALDPGSQRLWVVSLDAGVVTDFATTAPPGDRSTGRVGRPTDVALTAGSVWIADALDQTITILDASTGEARRTVEDVMARHIAFGLGSGWATDDIADRLLRLDAQSGEVAQALQLADGAYPTGVAVGADAIWVGNRGLQTLVRIDPANTGVVPAGVALGTTPDTIVAGASAVWVAGLEDDLVLRLDSGTSVSQTIEVCDQPVSLAEEADTIWVGCAGTGELWHMARDGTSLAQIDLGGVPSDIAVGTGASAGRIYVTVRNP